MLSPPIITQTSGPAAQDLAIVISRRKYIYMYIYSQSSACIRKQNNNNKKFIIIKRTLRLHNIIKKLSSCIVIHPAVYNERRPSLDCV